MSDSVVKRAAKVAGRTPSWVPPALWHEMIAAGARAMAEVQLEPNDGTPEEYAAAALRAALPLIHGRAWKAMADQLGERLSHQAFCNNRHTPATRDPDCPFCRDITAVEAWRRLSGRARH
jgi:hypothetical protein